MVWKFLKKCYTISNILFVKINHLCIGCYYLSIQKIYLKYHLRFLLVIGIDSIEEVYNILYSNCISNMIIFEFVWINKVFSILDTLYFFKYFGIVINHIKGSSLREINIREKKRFI